MGYYSSFTVLFPENMSEEHQQLIIREIQNQSGSARAAIDEHGHSYESVKWYAMKDECWHVAKCAPNISFCVLQVGEDFDIRFHYFHGNKYNQVPGKIVPESLNTHFPIKNVKLRQF